MRVLQNAECGKRQDVRRCSWWDAGRSQDAPRRVPVPACRMSRLRVKALWFPSLAAHLPLRLLTRSPLKVLQCFDMVSCQIAATGAKKSSWLKSLSFVPLNFWLGVSDAQVLLGRDLRSNTS